MNVAETLQAVGKLPLDEQAEFVFRAWDQLLERGWQPEVREFAPEVRAELQRRLKDFEADPTRVRTWEQIMERARSSVR